MNQYLYYNNTWYDMEGNVIPKPVGYMYMSANILSGFEPAKNVNISYISGTPTVKYDSNNNEIDVDPSWTIENTSVGLPAVYNVSPYTEGVSYGHVYYKENNVWYDRNTSTEITAENTITALETKYTSRNQTWYESAICHMPDLYYTISGLERANVSSESVVAALSGYPVSASLITSVANQTLNEALYSEYTPISEELEPEQLYKIGTKYYDKDGNEQIPSIEPVNIIDTGRFAALNKEITAWDFNGSIFAGYAYLNNISSSFTVIDGPYPCLFTYIKKSDGWYNVYGTGLNDMERVNAKYQTLLEAMILNAGTASLKHYNIGIAEKWDTGNDTKLAIFDTLGNSKEPLVSFSGDSLITEKLYIASFTEPTKVERPLVTTYTKTQGNLQRNNQPAIKVYNTLALANADISNIAANETVLIKDSGMYQKQNNALVAILGKKTLVDPYKVGDIRFVYDRNQVDSDWLLCDGSSFNQNDYPALYTALGNSTTLPNCTNRCLRPLLSNDETYLRTFSSAKFAQHKHNVTSPIHTHTVQHVNYSHNHTFPKLTTVNYQYAGYYYAYQAKPTPVDGQYGQKTPYGFELTNNTISSSETIQSEPYGSSVDNDTHINEASIWVYIKAR